MPTIPQFGQQVKRCTLCKEIKPIEEFSTRPGRPDWQRRVYCKACQTIKAREWQTKNPEKVKENDRKQGQKATRNGWHRPRELRRHYGLTLERWESILIAQEGVCACCFGPPTTQGFCVDHDHKTGQIRGLVCSSCNTMLGYAHDNPEILRRGAEYLERAKGE